MKFKTAKSILSPKRPLMLFAVFSAFSSILCMERLYLVGFLISLCLVVSIVVLAFLKANARKAVLLFGLLTAVILPQVVVIFSELCASKTVLEKNDEYYTRAVVYETQKFYDRTVLYCRLSDQRSTAVAVVTEEAPVCERFDEIHFDGIFFKTANDKEFWKYYEQNVEPRRILSKKCFVSAYAQNIKNLGRISREDQNLMQRYYFYVTDNMRECLDYFGNTDTFAFGKALLTGDRNSFPKGSYDGLSRSGIIHIMCISGIHVMILSSLLDKVLLFFGFGKRIRIPATIVLLLFFTLVTGGTGPIMRATLMSVFYKMFLIFKRKSDSFSAYGFSFCMIMFFNPCCIYDIGTLLSFLSLAGLITAQKTEAKNYYCENKTFLDRIKSSYTATFFINGFIFVPCLFFFGRVNILSMFSNYFSAIIFAPLMLFLILLAVFCFLPLPAREIIAFPTECLSAALDFFAKAFAKAELALTDFSLPMAAILIFAVMFAVFLYAVIFGNNRKISVSGFALSIFSSASTLLLHFVSFICG